MPSGRVRPGERLGYVERLRQRDLWPVTSINYDRGDPVATPYLVVPVTPDDNGIRPLPGDTALHNPKIEILDGTGTPVTQPTRGTPYTLRCTVRNLGAIGAYAGLAEFYVAAPSSFDQAAITFRASMRAVGYAGFVALPGTDSVIDCPGFWTPGSDQEAASSVLVQVYDPFTDPLSYPFDAREDRHVGRWDIAPVVRMPIIPYRSAAYKYLVVAHDEGVGFEQPGFNDTGFSLGDAGFGTSNGFCLLNNPTDVKTAWPSDTDILLRKQFFLPPGTSNLEVRVAIDNDVQVFLNGQDISRGLRTHEDCPSNDSFVFTAPDSLLVAGANLLAVRGRDRGVLCYLDVQVTSTTPASIVQNGSFANGTDPGVSTTVNPGDTNIDDWSVDSGNVDYIGTYWQAADGNRSIDMNGLTAGSISQTVPTVAGAVYTVSFDLSGNPDSASSVGVDPSLASPSNKQLSVSATGNPAQIYSFDTSVEGNTRSDMKWKPELYTFTATGSSTTLTFASAIKGAFGPALDNVVVNGAKA